MLGVTIRKYNCLFEEFRRKMQYPILGQFIAAEYKEYNEKMCDTLEQDFKNHIDMQ